MASNALNSFITIRNLLTEVHLDNGQISGKLAVSKTLLNDLQTLAENNTIEDTLLIDNDTVFINKINLVEGETKTTNITLYPSRCTPDRYYELLNDFISANQTEYPEHQFYIHDLKTYSGSNPLKSELEAFKQVLEVINLLSVIADYKKEETGQPTNFIFFDKRKLSVPVRYNRNHLKSFAFLPELSKQLMEAHDKDQRVTIFKNELIALLFEEKEVDRFGALLSKLDAIYESYQKSYLLYIEKFSYHDLKSELDDDKLEYTKKIYGAVNDIQTKLIAVPAAFLLVLSQFDFTNGMSNKNYLITVGCILFSILLEVLLSNQFGLLNYIEKEIGHFTNKLKNKETSVDLSEFITSFAGLNTTIKGQKTLLWIFRVIVWLVPVLCIIMLFVFKVKPTT